jgi:hypothetical protein
MVYIRFQKFLLFTACAAILFLFSCSKDKEPDTRSFYMGFTPFPYALSATASNDVYEKLKADGDIVNHHFDNGIPWQEALTGASFPQAVLDDWNYRKCKIVGDQKLLLSVTPINLSRTGLALLRGSADNMPLASPWSEYTFNHADVKTAYLNYCKRVIDFFQPHYFNMAIEANLLYQNKPEQWSAYMDLHTYIYHELKVAYPQLPIFSSVSGTSLMKGFIEGNDAVQQRLAVLQLMEYSDMYALSFYPYLSTYRGNAFPGNTLDELFHISGKPLAITGTGYVAQSFSMQTSGSPVTIEGNQLKQQKYFYDLLSACEKRKAEFVISFVVRDYDQLYSQAGASAVNIAWRDAGLYDENGMPRLALLPWKEYQIKKHRP